MHEFITVDDARGRILETLEVLGSERRLLSDCLGLRLAESIEAPYDSPAFDNSAMDGYAFRWDDREQQMRIVGESAAGDPFGGTVGAGEAIKIMTGAMVPDGADTVAKREICDATEDSVTLTDQPRRGKGANIRRQGEYMEAGAEVFGPGDRLDPAEIGMIASFGRTVVYVRRPARVAIVTTGTELVEPDRAPASGQIVNSNAYMLEGLVRERRATPVVLPIVPDDERATRAALRDVAATNDIVVTVGGVSVGDYDFVRQILDEMADGMTFWKVKMKPGKPLAFGTIEATHGGGVPVIGLPGNPVSSFVGFHQFVRPAIAVLQGAAIENATLPRTRLRTATDISSTPRRRQFVAGRISSQDGEAVFLPHPNQSSGNVLVTCRTDGFAVVEEGIDFVEANSLVDVEYL